MEKLTTSATNTSSSQVDPKALRWAQSNPWFGKDVAMTGAAYSIDAQLKTKVTTHLQRNIMLKLIAG